jgi:hypothetical protein
MSESTRAMSIARTAPCVALPANRLEMTLQSGVTPWRPSTMPALRSPPLVPGVIDAVPLLAARVAPKNRARPHRRVVRPRTDHVRQRLVRVTVALAVAAILLGRTDVVRGWPEAASLFRIIGWPVNLRGLKLVGFATHTEAEGGLPVLIVEGRIESDSRVVVMVPTLRLAVRDAAGAELYTWAVRPDATAVRPGESLPFRARLPSPPSRAYDIAVRFLHPSDG